MSTNQTHSGSGDNVGGNKNITNNFFVRFTILPIIFVLFGIFIFIYYITQTKKLPQEFEYKEIVKTTEFKYRQGYLPTLNLKMVFPDIKFNDKDIEENIKKVLIDSIFFRDIFNISIHNVFKKRFDLNYNESISDIFNNFASTLHLDYISYIDKLGLEQEYLKSCVMCYGSYDISAKIVYSDINILSIYVYEVFMCGGAHPTHKHRGFSFDLSKNGKLITFHELISWKKIKKLSEKLKEKCIEQIDGMEEKKELANDIYNALNTHKQIFFIKDDGLYFIFDPYLIGSYAEGYNPVFIPFKEVKTFFDESFLLKKYEK